MNDTGGGVTAIHDVPGDVTRIGFHWMLFFPFCHSKGASICSSHGVSRRSRIFFVPNLRICEFFSSHGVSRSVTDFFVTRLVLGPTDRREVICELSNCFFTRNVAEVTDFLSRDLSLDPLTAGR